MFHTLLNVLGFNQGELFIYLYSQFTWSNSYLSLSISTAFNTPTIKTFCNNNFVKDNDIFTTAERPGMKTDDMIMLKLTQMNLHLSYL